MAFAAHRREAADRSGVDVGLYDLLRGQEELVLGKGADGLDGGVDSAFPPGPPSPEAEATAAAAAAAAAFGDQSSGDFELLSKGELENGEVISKPGGQLNKEEKEVGGGDAEEEDDEAIKVYVDDVDYLEDKLRLNNLTATLAVERRKLEDSRGDEEEDQESLGMCAEMYYSRRSAGRSLAALKADGMAKVRKLEAQERELERNSGAAGPDLRAAGGAAVGARLERLTKALALDSFEVDVIVATVGSEVLPMRSPRRPGA